MGPIEHGLHKAVLRTGFADQRNGYGSLSVQDAVQILTYYAQQAAGCSPTFASDLQYTTADYDGDGSITVNDAVSVLETYAKQAAGLQPTLSMVGNRAHS